MIYFPTNWGAKEPQNLPNHRVGEADSDMIIIIVIDNYGTITIIIVNLDCETKTVKLRLI